MIIGLGAIIFLLITKVEIWMAILEIIKQANMWTAWEIKAYKFKVFWIEILTKLKETWTRSKRNPMATVVVTSKESMPSYSYYIYKDTNILTKI